MSFKYEEIDDESYLKLCAYGKFEQDYVMVTPTNDPPSDFPLKKIYSRSMCTSNR